MKKSIIGLVLFVASTGLASAQTWDSKWDWPNVPINQVYDCGDQPDQKWSDSIPVLDIDGYPAQWWLKLHPEYLVRLEEKKKK